MREKIIIILWFAQEMLGEGEDNNYTMVRPGDAWWVREKIIIILWFAQEMHGEGEDNNYTMVRPGDAW